MKSKLGLELTARNRGGGSRNPRKARFGINCSELFWGRSTGTRIDDDDDDDEQQNLGEEEKNLGGELSHMTARNFFGGGGRWKCGGTRFGPNLRIRGRRKPISGRFRTR